MLNLRGILIAGPTASGKSALALRLAEKLGAVIVNADSMQVYRDLRIITARPPPADETKVPHRLYGHVDAAENYSVGRWYRDTGQALNEIAAQRRVVILVGGTGLYFKSLSNGLAAVPPIPADIHEQVRRRLRSEGVAPLYSELLEHDRHAAHRLMPNDRSRICRALEVILATGRSLSDWHLEGMPALVDSRRSAKVFITCERKKLVRRMEDRFAAMLQAGALEEVRALAARNLDPSLPVMKAHGVPWLIRYLRGEISLNTATAGAIMDTRRYAKRQLTWFRNQMKDWSWTSAEEAEKVLEGQISVLKPTNLQA